MIAPIELEVKDLNLATTSARKAGVTQKLLQLVSGKYYPDEPRDLVYLRKEIDQILFQPDRLKLIRLYQYGVKVLRELLSFNPAGAESLT